MHNGKFDYQVIKCTCGLELSVYWDTMIGARILDENEKSAGLKQQYRDKIDSSVENIQLITCLRILSMQLLIPLCLHCMLQLMQ